MSKSAGKSSPLRSLFTAIAVGLNVMVAFLTIFSAYGGMVNPEKMVFASIFAMLLPMFLACGVGLLVLNILFWRKLAPVLILSWLLALPPLLEYSPLNLIPKKLTAEEKTRTFLLLTYNVLHFWDFRGNIPNESENMTLDYILSTNADIVSLQEAESIKGAQKVTQKQLREINRRYPFQYKNVAKQLSILSKYPVKHLDVQLPDCLKAHVACFRLNVMGDTIYLFNVHLESIGLRPEDKKLYMQLYDAKAGRDVKEEITEVKSHLIGKLAKAFRRRAIQAHALRSVIDSIGGNVIVAGDFNDIPGCYALRTIAGDDFKSAFSERGFGPTITYHGDRFYFRIDHVLYRGNFDAVRIRRARIPSSDHYPLLTTFLIDEHVNLTTKQ
ncbi:MAG: endonuclease/exonuclease/phosphatase family protein [Muribaculum sp.]|nr:endonuclease/exonuclease/phosphatase family protein [Muribaculum sp.]